MRRWRETEAGFLSRQPLARIIKEAPLPCGRDTDRAQLVPWRSIGGKILNHLSNLLFSPVHTARSRLSQHVRGALPRWAAFSSIAARPGHSEGEKF